MALFTQSQRQEIFSLLQQNRKVEAVKWVKEHSNLGLKESKDWIEQLIENPSFDDTYAQDSEDGAQEVFYPKDTSIYKALEAHYDVGEIYILYQDGRRELIDEDYPEWNTIMDQFAQGEHFETDYDFLDAMEIRDERDFHHEQQSDNSQTTFQSQHSFSRPMSTQSQPVGIEDQSKKNGLSRLVMIIVIVIVAVMAYQFIGKS